MYLSPASAIADVIVVPDDIRKKRRQTKPNALLKCEVIEKREASMSVI